MHSSKACPAESGWHPPLHALVEAEGWHHQSGLEDFIDKQLAISVKEIIYLKITCKIITWIQMVYNIYVDIHTSYIDICA